MESTRSDYFVIRQKSTGLLFPATGRGSTVAVFGDGSPRLFPSYRAAKLCLNWWLGGPCRMTKGPDTWMGNSDWDLEVTPDPSRKAEDCEIVRVNLNFEAPVLAEAEVA